MIGDFDQFSLVAGMAGGLALFLLGMDIMTRALERSAGEYLKSVLGKVSHNRLVGVGTGAVVTALVQSSSITTVLLVGFISAGLMSTAQSVAIIFGANIGSTVTAQILAFNVTRFALPVLALGFFVSFLATRERWRQYGLVVLGLGLVFYGMGLMSDAMRPLRGYEPFLRFMVELRQPLLAAFVGAAFTAVIQSSAVTTGILIAMAGQGLLELDAAIAIALGANVGTCVTAGLASMGKPREAVRAAAVHTLFNVAGVLIWIGFVPELAQLARLISPSYDGPEGSVLAAAEMPRQIANIHTFFNVANTLLFIGFSAQFSRLVERMIPDRPMSEEERMAPRFLSEELLGAPSIALDAARREIARLGGMVCRMLRCAMPTAVSAHEHEFDRLEAMDRPVNRLHRDILDFLRRLSQQSLTATQSATLLALIGAANDLEHIGDQLSIGLVRSARKRVEEGVVVSAATAAAFERLHAQVAGALEDAIVALEREDAVRAAGVCALKHELAQHIDALARYEMQRLRAQEPRRLTTYAREIEVVEILDDIVKSTRRIARAQLELSHPGQGAGGAEGPNRRDGAPAAAASDAGGRSDASSDPSGTDATRR